MKLLWHPLALDDRRQIIDFIAQDSPLAAADLDDLFEEKTAALPQHPRLYKAGRVKGTREMVMHPNYVAVYKEERAAVTILRILHTARQWPWQRQPLLVMVSR
jgi:toxin ParE1/3/4